MEFGGEDRTESIEEDINVATGEKSRFNFTLRELLLAMVAVGALLALAVKSYERAQPGLRKIV